MAEKRCGLYVRVSTLNQAREGESIPAQVKRLKDYVAARSTTETPWTVVDAYVEKGVSAKEGSIDRERKEFRRMMEDARTGHINMIMVTKIDRLTRSLRDFYGIWSDFEKYGVEFCSLAENFDSSTLMGRFALKLVLLFAELEREITGERTLNVLEWRASQGMWNGSHVMGFRANEDGTLCPQEEELRVVQLIFEKCAELGSAGTVLNYLNKHGYRMPKYETRAGTTRGGGRFNKQTIINILMNPVYRGKIRYGGKEYEGKHKAVIEASLFSKVQGILNKNRDTRRGKKPNDRTYILRGLLRDGKCGHMMTPYSSGGRGGSHFYYRCTANCHGGKHVCDTKYAPASAVEKLVLEFVRKITLDEDYIARATAVANQASSEDLKKTEVEEASTERHLNAVNEQLHNIARAVGTGGDQAFRTLKEEMDRLEVERGRLEEVLAEIKVEKNALRQHVVSAEVMIQTLRHLAQIIKSANPEQCQQILPQIIEVVEWHENPKKPGTGEIRVALFEEFQPERLDELAITWTPKGLTTEPFDASRSQDWLR